MTDKLIVAWVAIFLAAGTVGAAVPTVTTVSPLAQRITAAASGDVVVQFSTAIDPATVTSATFRVWGRWSGPASGAISFESGNLVARFSPSAPLFAGEWVTVTLGRGIKSAGGELMVNPYTWNFWIATAAGELLQSLRGTRPVRAPLEGWIQSYGAYAGDLNNDGWSDLAIPNEQTADVRVFLNDGSGDYGSFVVSPLPGGASPSTNEGADFNHDGEIDIVVGSGGNDKVTVLRGNGSGGFLSTVTYTAANSVKGVGVIDLNGDGWEDFVTANRFGNNLSVFLNDGAGNFPATGTALEAGGSQEFSCAVSDFDNDGIQDVVVGVYVSATIIFLRGDAAGGLTASPPVAIGGQPWMLAVGDVNNDGNADVVAANSGANNAGVALGDGAGHFQAAVTYPTGNFPLAIDLGDLDGDGDLDLVTSNYGSASWTVYENQAGVFVTPRTLAASASGSCAILHDRDNDGDLDISGIDEIDDLIFLFDNDPPVSSTTPIAAPGISVEQNHPNPFNPSTTLRFRLDWDSAVRVSVADAQGHVIRVLAERMFSAGPQSLQWDGTDEAGSRVASGAYFARFEAAGRTITVKMLLIK